MKQSLNFLSLDCRSIETPGHWSVVGGFPAWSIPQLGSPPKAHDNLCRRGNIYSRDRTCSVSLCVSPVLCLFVFPAYPFFVGQDKGSPLSATNWPREPGQGANIVRISEGEKLGWS